jgi:oligopeptide transport system substrate-binding protein
VVFYSCELLWEGVFMNLLRLLLIGATLAIFMPQSFAMADNSSITVTAQYYQAEEVVLNIGTASEISSLDPAIASDVISFSPIENLFHGLTDVDPVTSQIVPELATSWEVSSDGKLWTFHLRSDVMWYRYDPETKTPQELRPVVAEDVVYGVKRGCDPRLGGYYGTIIASVIAGCNEINQTPATEVTDAMVFGDTTKVSAPDDTTVTVELQFPAGYFLSMTPMWIMRPVHRETIEEYGDEWTAPGNIVTNGPFFIQELVRGVSREFVRNPLHPADLGYDGNIQVIKFAVIEDQGTIFTLYLDNQVDTAGIPDAELQGVLENDTYEDEVIQVYSPTVFYFAFAHDKAPFDNVHIRRAFSAIIDRAAFVEQVNQGQGVPMIHFTPPGITYAPPINEVGLGFDPEYAAKELELGGYPNCEGFPNVNIATFYYAEPWVEFLASAAEEYLGCSFDLFTAEPLEFSLLLQLTSDQTPTNDRPHMWTWAWAADYSDANNWVGDVLSCERDTSLMRPCNALDDLINSAGQKSDPTERLQLYSEIEGEFFGIEGEAPIVPIFMGAGYALIKPWYTGPFKTDGLFGGAHWDAYSIDIVSKLKAQG